jgi:hypothetical protein
LITQHGGHGFEIAAAETPGHRDRQAATSAPATRSIRWCPFWGAMKIHGELLKLGIQVAQSTVSIYMVPRRDRPLQTWKTFVHNHIWRGDCVD